MSEDNFKNKFKYYKSNNPKPTLVDVLQIDDHTFRNNVVLEVRNKKLVRDPRAEYLGLHNLLEWKKYSFPKHPGLYMIRNPFTCIGQRYWIRKCLEEYPRRPNKTNLDIEMCVQDWWATCFETDICNRKLQKKLRWTTLGYHHDWNTKVYSERNKSTFPEDLAELSDIVACFLGYTEFTAQAAIVNYYHMDSSLSAHTDHSEVNLEAPLFSFSFGQPAIFLIGGADKSSEPSAILVDSGDIMVMSKEARLCYHAVPRILESPLQNWNDCNDLHNQTCKIRNLSNCISTFKYINNYDKVLLEMESNADNNVWENYNNYILESRINMNVRQVLKENQNSLSDPV